MHLLVLSAFRPRMVQEAQHPALGVSMHLLVLSAFRRYGAVFPTATNTKSQCTFWCSVLSDLESRGRSDCPLSRLNAPFGAQCFPTLSPSRGIVMGLWVSMHLLVLSAFRLEVVNDARLCLDVSMHLLVLSAFRPHARPRRTHRPRSQCTFWCSVLSDAFRHGLLGERLRSQCTFWCSVLSDAWSGSVNFVPWKVSMHLLVLSAFRRRHRE